MHTSDSEPNIPGAIGMLFLVAIAGALFVNLMLARHVLSPDSLLSMFEKIDTVSLITTRIEDANVPVDGLEEKAAIIAKSPETKALVLQHATYLTDYLLTGKEENRVTQQDLEAALLPYVKEWSSDPNLSDEALLATTQQLIEQTKLMTVFQSAKSYLPGKLASRIQLILNKKIFLLVLGLLLLFILMLLLACRLKLFLLFLGFSTFLTGLFTLLFGKLAALLIEVLFSNSLLLLIITAYRNEVTRAQNLLFIAGAIGILLGVSLLVFFRIRRNNHMGLQEV